MPLPLLIPVAIGTSALVGAIFGTYKGVSAKNNYAKASSIRNAADEEFSAARADYESASDIAKKNVEDLGKLRLETQAGLMARFVGAISQIKGVGLKEIAVDHPPAFRSIELPEIQANASIAQDILTGGAATVGAGIGAYTGATSAVATFGSASTGTAISALSGAAATNATMAWFGGGAASAGGLGAAAGTAIVGAFGIGALVAVGGLAVEKHSAQELTDAESEAAARRITAAELRRATTFVEGINLRALEISDTIHLVSSRLEASLLSATSILSTKALQAANEKLKFEADKLRFDSRNALARWLLQLFGKKPVLGPSPLEFNRFGEEEKQAIELTVGMGIALYGVLKLELMDELGELSTDPTNTLDAAKTAAAIG